MLLPAIDAGVTQAGCTTFWQCSMRVSECRAVPDKALVLFFSIADLLGCAQACVGRRAGCNNQTKVLEQLSPEGLPERNHPHSRQQHRQET